MKKSYFKIFKDSAGEWRWTLYAANHEPVVVSEGYTRRESAEAMALKLWYIAYEAVKQQLVTNACRYFRIVAGYLQIL